CRSQLKTCWRSSPSCSPLGFACGWMEGGASTLCSANRPDHMLTSTSPWQLPPSARCWPPSPHEASPSCVSIASSTPSWSITEAGRWTTTSSTSMRPSSLLMALRHTARAVCPTTSARSRASGRLLAGRSRAAPRLSRPSPTLKATSPMTMTTTTYLLCIDASAPHCSRRTTWGRELAPFQV
ncbi:MAG: hypothetical protein AVDCRST_MAG52-1311, partial [uncultured Blastococcus sp.]